MAIEELTDRCRKAIARAEMLARRRGHRRVDTHHLLLALAEPGSGISAELLQAMGIGADIMGPIIEVIDPRAGTEGPGGGLESRRLPLTLQAQEAIRLAGEAAEGLGHEVIGTDHLLLGLLDQETGAAAAVLKALGVTADAVRREFVARVLERLEGRLRRTGNPPRRPPAAPPT